MPKASVAQTGFNTGEVSPLFYGSVDNPRYKKGLAKGLNYIPVLQGPLVRRPGSKFSANVKDSANPSYLVPFKFSTTQNYMLEFGDGYIRFFTNNAQVLTSGTTYKLAGDLLVNTFEHTQFLFYATRTVSTAQAFENITSTATVANGSVLELQSPYALADLPQLRWAQEGDTVYLTHPGYPPFKLQRQGTNAWKLGQVFFIDGPYLQANTYSSVGDFVGAKMAPLNTTLPTSDVMVSNGVSVANTSNSGGLIKITTSAAHGFTTGQGVFINGVVGTTEANNWSSYSGRAVANSHPAYWLITVIDSTSFTLGSSTYSNAYVSGGTVSLAVFSIEASVAKVPGIAPSLGRAIALQISGARYWGVISHIWDAVTVQVLIGGTALGQQTAFPGTTVADQWFLGAWYGAGIANGSFPAVCEFHQNRLCLAGTPNLPQRVDGSCTGLYEVFSPSPVSGAGALVVADNSAWNFTLNSPDLNPLRWLKSTAQGLLAASAASEWAMTPSGQSEALTATNFNAQQTSYYGGAQVAPVKIGNAVLYMQNAQRKLREMTFFFYAGTFRSTDLSEISEHITIPSISQLAVQKEPQPLIWGLRSDGALVSLVYNRDDVSLSVGWTAHQLGGRSDSAGSPPVVHSIGVIPDPTGSFDQLWMIVKRYINGAAVYTIEYMTRVFDDSVAQEDAFQGDCGGTYDSPLTITGISLASPAVVTSAAHGLTAGQQVRLNSVVGLNVSSTDVNNVTTVTNPVNGKTFVVGTVTTNTFQLLNQDGSNLDTSAASAYVSGGQARKLVSTLAGLSWLLNETVQILADGALQPDATVDGSGNLALSYPASKVQLGFAFKSQAQLLRTEAGSATGTSQGQLRRLCRAAIQVHRAAELSVGMDFTDMQSLEFAQADVQQADQAVALFSGFVREGLLSAWDFDNQFCFQQSSMLPGTVQSVALFVEEQDV